MIRWLSLLIGATVLVGCSTVPKSFNPENPIPPQSFSHQAWEETLREHVKDGVVNYPALATEPRFGTYLRQLDRVDPNSLPTHEDSLAFWINAYNAFAIKGILDGYSPMTLFGRYRYFIARDYEVGGQVINLYDLERKLLIPDFSEPRTHFAIVCASLSCPKLRSRAYTGDTLEQQLEDSARAFINDPTRNQFDMQKKIARLSMIFKWFEQDFAVHSGSLISYVRRYVEDRVLARELETTPYRIEFLEYDWRLNGPSPSPEVHGGRSS